MSKLGVFDPQAKLVTSYLFKPGTLAWIRLSFALLTTAILIFCIVYQAVVLKTAQQFLSYFTNDTYFGICGYFWASGLHTWSYSKRGEKTGTYSLQRWPKLLQYLHVLLHTTVITFPFIVTVAFWTLIAPTEAPFDNFFDGFSNVTKHLMNSLFALFELFLTNGGPQPWLNLLWTILILGMYTGLAYVTHATQGFYPYTFLDPNNGDTKVVLYVVGIIAAQIVLFLLTRGIILAREKLVSKWQGTHGNRTASASEMAGIPFNYQRISVGHPAPTVA